MIYNLIALNTEQAKTSDLKRGVYLFLGMGWVIMIYELGVHVYV